MKYLFLIIAIFTATYSFPKGNNNGTVHGIWKIQNIKPLTKPKSDMDNNAMLWLNIDLQGAKMVFKKIQFLLMMNLNLPTLLRVIKFCLKIISQRVIHIDI